jgi:polyphenol oxidase
MAAELALLRPDWPVPPSVAAAVTTRAGGVSTGPWASLNLGDHVGDDPASVAENRRRLRVALGLAVEPGWLAQVHGTAVARLDAVRGARPEADAAVAFAPGPACAILTADCLPVLLCDAAGTRVGAAHAGWRGLAGGVIEAAVAALGCPPDDLLAWLGPAIGQDAFEVGGDVRAAFVDEDARAASAFRPNERGRWQANLEALARLRLARAGVTRVYGGGWCTHADPARWYSHRRDGRCGRMASLVWLR